MKRQQINIRVDDDDIERIERIRRTMHPIPTVTDAIKAAIREMDEKFGRGRKR